MPAAAEKRVVLLFGLPGSGKGTQGAALGVLPEFVHVSSGEVFRQLPEEGPHFEKIQSYTTRGLLVPDDLTVDIFTQHVNQLERLGKYRSAKDVLIMDGIPRTYQQAEMLSKNLSVLKVFYLELKDDEEALRRIRGRSVKQGRSDDADEAIIRDRFETFRRQTLDSLRYYDSSVVHRLDASMPAIRVTHAITGILAETLDPSSKTGR